MISHGAARTGAFAVFAAALLALAGPRQLSAQDGWQATLIVDPLPSPYLSDWEVDVTIGELIVTNTTNSTTDITIYYTLTRNGQVLLNGVTDPQTVLANESVVFNADSDVGGEVDWDAAFEDLLVRTGRLPEGEYEGCVTIVDANGLVLVDRECVRFSTLYPDPPFLVFPFDGDTITTQDPIFEWLPVQVPALEGFRVGYVLAIAEVNAEGGQLPEVALESNILHYVEPDLLETSHQYPVGALPFEPGRTYAWRVQALDGEGAPTSANSGRSEVWTFVYKESEAELEQVVASVDVTPGADTLRFVGDTLRFSAAAYDPDNLEVVGRRFEWRSSDTTIAKVDSAGVVTAVGAGEAKIVALLDGIADTALSITSVPTGLTVGFELYDSDGTTPSLLELIQSGSFEEVVPQLMARLEAGEFRIPIPRIASLWGGDEGGDVPPGSGPDAPHGPNVDLAKTGMRSAADGCWEWVFDANTFTDLNTKVFVADLALSMGHVGSLVDCLTDPYGSGPTNPERRVTGAAFVVSWQHPGLPRAFLVFKAPGLSRFPIGGTQVEASFVVINPTRSLTVEQDLLPDSLYLATQGDEFLPTLFGDVSFDAGVGITFYSTRRCVDTTKLLCQFLTWINPNDPVITFHAFKGVTASETSLGTREDSTTSRVGTSLALGFSITASLPVRTFVELREDGYTRGEGLPGLTLDSTQVGLQFAAQDSINQSAIQDSGGVWRDTTEHGLSVSIAPTLTAWLSDSLDDATKRRPWEVTASIGLEWDPTAEEAKKPKLVASANLSTVWQFGPFRIGNPTLVFTTPLGERKEREETELAVSGIWGFGPNEGMGLSDGEAAFEEVGRGAVTLKWVRQDSAAVKGKAGTPARDAADSLAYWRRAARKLEAEAEEDPAKDLEWRAANRRVIEWGMIARSAGSGAPQCSGRMAGGRCLTWSARLSVGNGALMDVFAMLVRLGVTQ